MDELRLLAEFLREPSPTSQTVRRGRARLLALTTRRPRQVWRRGVRLGLGVAVTAAAVAVAVTSIAPHAPTRSGGPSGARAGVVAVSAQDVLLAAAKRQQGQPSATGAWWLTHTQDGQARQVGTADNRYVIEQRTELRLWTPARGTRGWASSRTLGWRPQGPDDVAAWRRAGSPAGWATDLNPQGRIRATPGGPPPPSTGPREMSTRPAPWSPPERVSTKLSVADEHHPVTVAELRALPTDPRRLRAWLLDKLQLRTPRAGDAAQLEYLFGAAENLLAMPITAEVRGATYRMLAALPGLRAIPEVRDPLGRRGDAIALRTNPTVQRQLIVDPVSGALLASQTVLIAEDAQSWPGTRRGTRLDYIAVVSAGWTDDSPRP